jgi:hypothetical protein
MKVLYFLYFEPQLMPIMFSGMAHKKYSDAADTTLRLVLKSSFVQDTK